MKKVLHINLHIPVIYPNLSGWAWGFVSYRFWFLWWNKWLLYGWLVLIFTLTKGINLQNEYIHSSDPEFVY